MRESLVGRIQQVGRVAGQWRLIGGAARALAIGLAVWLILGGLDYGLRVTDSGLRWMMSLGAWGAAIWGGWRYLVPAWPRQIDPVLVARQLENYFPNLRDRLACACEFVDQLSVSSPDYAHERRHHTAPPQPRRGSLTLRRAAVAQTVALAEHVDFAQALDLSPVRRSLAWFALAAGMGLVGVLLDPASTGLAARRLALPWLDESWPRQHQLEWVDLPQRVAIGSELTIELRDRNDRLPDSVELWFESEQDSYQRVERVAMRQRDRSFVYRFESLTHAIRLRAVGGDDDTLAWRTIEVDEPPRIELLDVRLVPPEYTGRGPERGGQPLRGLAGTNVQLVGVATTRLSSARIRAAESDAPTLAEGQVLSDGVSFVFGARPDSSWILQQSGSFVLELADETGLLGEAQRFAVQVLPDEPPTITWESPLPDDAATPSAVVPVRVVVGDDLALRRVAMWYRSVSAVVTDSEAGQSRGGQEIVLHEGPAFPKPPTDVMGDAPGETRPIELLWDLSSVGDMQAGMSLELWISAEDYTGQVVETPTRRLLLITSSELDDRFSQRETLVMNLLNEALQAENESRQQMGIAEAAVREQQRLDPRHADQLQATELKQRQIGRLLGNDRDGAGAAIAALLAGVANNRRERAMLVMRLERIQRELASLEREHLRFIGPLLVAARKGSPVIDADGTQSVDSQSTAQTIQQLADAGRHADAVCRRLEQLLLELSPWDEMRRTMREFARIQRDQEDLQKKTADHLKQTDSNPATEGERVVDQAWLVERQFELERRFGKTTSRLEQLQTNLAATSPDSARHAMLGAVEAAKQSQAGPRMREAAQQLDLRRWGRALQLQDDALEELRKLLDIASGRTTDRSTPSALPRIEQAVLTILAGQQSVHETLTRLNQERLDAGGKIDDAIRTQLTDAGQVEQSLADRTAELADEARRQGADAVQLALHGAVDQSRRVVRLLAESPRPDLAAAIEALELVVARLQLLVDSLRPDATTPIERDPARTNQSDLPPNDLESRRAQRVKSLAELKLLQSLQAELQRRTAQLDTARRRQGKMTPEMTREAQELASEQGRLAELVLKLLESP